MGFLQKIEEVQKDLTRLGVDGWLIADDHAHNTCGYIFLEMDLKKKPTRRLYYWIPQRGAPVKILPKIEPYSFDHLPGSVLYYRSWQEMEQALGKILQNKMKILMEYSPRHALPNTSKIDAGLLDVIREMGVDVASSAYLLQKYTSVLTKKQIETHLFAAEVLCRTADLAWQFIEKSLKTANPIDEYIVQQFILKEIEKAGCLSSDLPICAVNENAADPHYTPIKGAAKPIREGDFILIDLWCKQDLPHSVYADIARVAFAGENPMQKHVKVFEIVKQARLLACEFIKEGLSAGRRVLGCEVDQVCRNFIAKMGFGDFFIHRTGHNIGIEVHGDGANLDDFETHDDRPLLPGTCFSIEPGIYLPGEFGVRLECDMYIDQNNQAHVTGGFQENIYTWRR